MRTMRDLCGGRPCGDDDLPAVLVSPVLPVGAVGSDDNLSRGVLLAGGALPNGLHSDGRLSHDRVLADYPELPDGSVRPGV